MSHNECITKHTAFHQEAGKVFALINAAKYSEAEAAIGSGTAYAAVSSVVGVVIIKLKKEAGL